MALFRRDPNPTRRKRATPARLEGVDAERRRARRKHIAAKAALIAALVLLTLAAFGRERVFEYTTREGDVWRQDNLVAPFTFAIQKPDSVVAAELRRIRLETPPYFVQVGRAEAALAARRDSLQTGLSEALTLGAVFAESRSRGRLADSVIDSVRVDSARAGVPVTLSRSQWDLLADSYNARIPGLATSSRSAGRRLDEMLVGNAYGAARQVLRLGILNVRADSLRPERITIRDEVERSERVVDKSKVYGRAEAFQVASTGLAELYPNSPDTLGIALTMLGYLLQPSLRYDGPATRAAWAQAERDLSPNEDAVLQNEVIIRTGDRITPEIQRKLISLENAQNDRRGGRVAWEPIAGQFLVTLAVYFLFFLYLFLLRRSIFDDNRLLLLIAILIALVVGLFAIAMRVPALDPYMVPVAVVSILFTVVFDSRVAIFGTLTLTLIGGLLFNFDFTYALATLFAATIGIFSVRDIRNRGQFFVSAGLVLLGYAIVLFAAFLIENTSLDRLLAELLYVGINATLLLLAYPLLWVVERAFGLTTDITLLELSDTNRPLLKELSLKAPGTLNHVLQVANLAEAAASAIGANALLTRVGALYHDIGKMVKPEYFVENQRGGVNAHDQLKPRMSALIIASHVKEGLDIGLRNRLPQRVLDFIPMHHGTTRIEYFFRRAEEMRKDDEPPISESEYRYPGPRPNTRETAILMLADSVEAASRSLSNPTHKRLESLIAALVEARRADGQLDDADLTFRDLRVVKETFLNLLMGVFHVRVRYPGDEEEEEVKPAREEAEKESSTPDAEQDAETAGP